MEAVVSQRPWRRAWGEQRGPPGPAEWVGLVTLRACGAREGGKAVPENKWIVSDRVAESIREPQM